MTTQSNNERSAKLASLLSTSDVLVSQKPGSVLTMLFRRTMNDLHVSGGQFQILLDQYVSRFSKTATPIDADELVQALCKSEMSFEEFLQGLQLLQAKNAVIVLELTDEAGRKTLHTTQVNFNLPALE
jgi:hypothetical protein